MAISLNTCGYPLILGVVRWGRGLSPPVIRTAVRGAWLPGVDGSPVALGSTGAHEVWVKQMIPHQGPTPLTGLQVFTDTVEYR